jgi:GntR family transcriptional regulator
MPNRKHPRYEKGVPVYFQIESILRHRIQAAGQKGALLPSEAELAAEFHVARSTLRRALAGLEEQRVIVRRKGRGTYVSDESLDVQVKKLTGFIDDLMAHGFKTHAKVLECRAAVATSIVADRLGLRTGEPVLDVARIRFVDDRPLAVTRGYLPWDLGRRVMTEPLEQMPILHILTKRYRIPILEAEQTVEAVLAEPESAGHLEVVVGSPLLDVQRVYYGLRRVPKYYARSLFRADRYRFTVSLKRRQHG